ncbi:PIN domain-containing protein [Streptomyces sp. NPDC058385]|uniref:PIN domain-containing protein n=1 Tax=Streptomyces sp. NPDC058385 TaxID=3346473 RepID=UPI00365B5F92
MIIFDTNALNLLSPESPRADFIRKLRQSGHHRVAVPWVVMEELAAHQATHYPDKYRAVVNTLAKLQEVLPWHVDSSLEPLDVDRLLGHWRGIYGEIFEVIETSGDVARQALAREAMHLPPAKRAKDHSEGARDVAIWFSVIEFLKANPEEHIYFVTNNSSDFGDGTAYPYPMNEDVRGLEERLTLLKDFDQVVSRFSKEVSGKDAEAAAGELLRSLSVGGRVAQTAMDLSSPAGFVGLGPADATVEWHEWLAQPEVELLSVMNVTGHEIEGDVWYTANATWLLYGLAADGPESAAGYVACVWGMKVLFSTRDGDDAPTFLKTSELSAPDTSDAAVMGILRRLKERVANVSRRAVRRVQTAVIPDQLFAQQLASSLPKLDIAGHLNPSIAQIAASMKLNMDAIVGRSAMEQLRASIPDIGYGTIIGRSAMKQLQASLPKIDIPTMLPRTNIADLLAASARAQTLAGLPVDAEEGEQGEDEQLTDPDVNSEQRGPDADPDAAQTTQDD